MLTREGRRKLEEELDHLISKKRKEIAERLRDAKSFGDISENSEFEDAKNEQSFIEGRIREIKHVLTHAEDIDEKKATLDRISIGLTATLFDLETEKKQDFKVVGSYEANPDSFHISHESPIGKALLGKKVGEVVTVELPHGPLKYRIEKIAR